MVLYVWIYFEFYVVITLLNLHIVCHYLELTEFKNTVTVEYQFRILEISCSQRYLKKLLISITHISYVLAKSTMRMRRLKNDEEAVIGRIKYLGANILGIYTCFLLNQTKKSRRVAITEVLESYLESCRHRRYCRKSIKKVKNFTYMIHKLLCHDVFRLFFYIMFYANFVTCKRNHSET